MTGKEKDACPITGHMSTHKPNLQNPPIRTEEGRRIRDPFIPRPVTKERPKYDYRIEADLFGKGWQTLVGEQDGSLE